MKEFWAGLQAISRTAIGVALLTAYGRMASDEQDLKDIAREGVGIIAGVFLGGGLLSADDWVRRFYKPKPPA